MLPPAAVRGPMQDLLASADFVLVATHDETLSRHESGPGPVASQGWFEAEVARISSQLPAHKLIFAIGAFGYHWDAQRLQRRISVQEAWDTVRLSQADLHFDRRALNPRLVWNDEAQQPHETWFLDGITAFNQVRAALAVQPAGIAIWRLGLEDPGVWASVGRGRVPDNDTLPALRLPKPGYDTFSRVDGVLLSALPGSDGVRSLTVNDRAGLIVDVVTSRVPVQAAITTWKATDPKAIVLTFDDGPDPIFTAKILDVLAAKSVKATFYVTGRAATRAPDLLRRIYHEGHEIGNHSFSHPDLGEAGSERVRLELNAVQSILEAEVGIRSLLFRPPYAYATYRFLDSGPHVALTASSLGYLIANLDVDSGDWFGPADLIRRSVMWQVEDGGRVVLLHDAGGNRQPTVDALPNLIDDLRSKGFHFVTTHELVGRSRDDVMPPAEASEVAAQIKLGVRVLFVDLVRSFSSAIPPIALAVTGLGILRLVLLLIGANVQWRRSRRATERNWLPSRVAVLVPAFNEDKVICKTVRTLLDSTIRERLDILVIDDGSTDQTAEVVRQAFPTSEGVRVLTKENGGKASALNYGVSATEAEIVVAIDGDTVILSDAIERLVGHFADPCVGAVAGKIVVGNATNLLTRFQSLEYITTQNVDRRAFELFNAIGVVPGALGAWRRDAIITAGGYSRDTLAEDADLTLSVALQGWRIIAEPRATALTEAPETLRAFLKQRFRWMFGTLQVGYKHCGSLRSPSGISLLTVPNIFLFQFAFTLFAPIMDFILLWTLATDDALLATSGILLQYWLFFQVLDAGAATAALALESDRSAWRLLPLIVLQRFCYRQLLYWVAIRALLAALRGRLMGWGKLIRTGGVVVPVASAN
jgi:cellulose synthase/poly-beta-1,6-N-acetylglucosamine synthase-like glycosyltransferase/peptidoglycan/xylan/chitin deacetylase (PgdA/CDA1 family)